jgi:hypothetical protein
MNEVPDVVEVNVVQSTVPDRCQRAGVTTIGPALSMRSSPPRGARPQRAAAPDRVLKAIKEKA